ncbi:hypothetical protein P280DRAFT_36333 [Massarina eburnea CBS 473.64]|uniref:M protein, serotype 2.1 n=1 Tax=Massarina eburnea CBS 473.64 TaxID=1395130 RepID=A0A6A6S2G3_9PLEO|nr:hypothetical protein P280DRAFT_36333 [Massarina eburnea CBS 473.64]
MSTTARKPAPPGTPVRDPAARVASPGVGGRTSSSRSSIPAANGANGVAKPRLVRSGVNGTPVSARSAVRKPGAHSSSPSMSSSRVDSPDDDAAREAAREEAAAYMADLKERLQKAESEVNERKKSIEVLNARLDDALTEQSKLEERAHEEEEKVETLDNEKRELTRQHRELESIYEAERAQTMKEKEEAQTKEEELQQTIQRLKEAMAAKNIQLNGEADDSGKLSRTSSFRNNPSRNSSSQNLETANGFAPPSSVQRSDSRNHSKLIHQKDKIIEDLRLEMAEVQIKLMEAENVGGGRMQELEKQLLETRMTNARLMEDNESFQLLLGEKTLNGDLSRGELLRPASPAEERAPSRNGPMTSLADELDSVEGAEGDIIRKLEAEVNNLKGENKALTLYINKIIGRLLTHQGFESVLGDDHAPPADTNKDLPPPPPPKDITKDNEGQSFLARAKSVVGGGTRQQVKPRPFSYNAPGSTPSMHEDPNLAPSIPLQRSQTGQMTRSTSFQHHRHSTSDAQAGAANVITNMFRMPPPNGLSGPTSPSIVSPRSSIFGLPINGPANGSTPSSRAPSAGNVPIREEKDEKDDAKSTLSSETSNASGHVDTPSPPRSKETSTMTGKQMRPLRLVQNEEAAMRERKAANRASWFGGFFGGAEQPKIAETSQ